MKKLKYSNIISDDRNDVLREREEKIPLESSTDEDLKQEPEIQIPEYEGKEFPDEDNPTLGQNPLKLNFKMLTSALKEKQELLNQKMIQYSKKENIANEYLEQVQQSYIDLAAKVRKEKESQIHAFNAIQEFIKNIDDQTTQSEMIESRNTRQRQEITDKITQLQKELNEMLL